MAGPDLRSSPNAHFLATDALSAAAPAHPIHGAFSLSVATHALGFLLLAVFISRLHDDSRRSTAAANRIADVVWLPQPGLLRGGGGSGSGKPDPAGTQQESGREPLTVPPVKSESSLTDTARVDQEIQIPAVAMTAGIHDVPGIVTTLSLAATDSQGLGTGIQGQEAGSGPGPGLGPGRLGGMGGDAYHAGNGVTGPRLIKEMKPAYTAEAMRARIQGTVRLEAVVLPDGSVGRVRIIRSLDSTFGLDAQAVAAVKAWRFMPGTFAGRPVSVPVDIELAFTLR